MPNVRVHNERVNVGIRGGAPNVHVSSTGVKILGETVEAGTPMGLLLALTYASSFKAGMEFFGDERPNVRIK